LQIAEIAIALYANRKSFVGQGEQDQSQEEDMAHLNCSHVLVVAHRVWN